MKKKNERRPAKRVTVPVSTEAIRRFMDVPPLQRAEYIEEMIALKAALPTQIQDRLRRHRELARRKVP